MDSQFEKKIIEDLEKSGFSSELRAIRQFLSCGWKCSGFANYYDKDQGLITGVDLIAWKDKEEHLEGLRYGVQFNIAAEVKKSEKPWLVFKEHSKNVIDDYKNNLTHICGLVPYDLQRDMSLDSVYAKLGWRAYGIHESFKSPNAPSRSYSAMIQACKYAESRLDACSAYYKEVEEQLKDSKDSDYGYKESFVVFVKPIVILDGKLFAASLSNTADISIEEIKFTSFEFYYKSKQCSKGLYLVDIVTLDGLEEYINLSERRQQRIFDKIKSLVCESMTQRP